MSENLSILEDMRGPLGEIQLAELRTLYSGPGRHYHTLDHLAEMFRLGRPHGLTEAQALAIWYHDAIYDVPGEDNEAKSAELASKRLPALGIDAETIAEVQQIILDTKHHLPTIEASKLVLDLDLASLAAEPEVFDLNTQLIRQEFTIVPDEDFRLGRTRFFESYLARDQLYHSGAFAHFEAKARANLERALGRSE
jgi:predicted metal-dependent HD superfamily phosphohydrolase